MWQMKIFQNVYKSILFAIYFQSVTFSENIITILNSIESDFFSFFPRSVKIVAVAQNHGPRCFMNQMIMKNFPNPSPTLSRCAWQNAVSTLVSFRTKSFKSCQLKQITVLTSFLDFYYLPASCCQIVNKNTKFRLRVISSWRNASGSASGTLQISIYRNQMIKTNGLVV